MMKYLFETSINVFLQKRVHYLLVCGAVEERNQVLLIFMFLFTENIQKAFAELTSMLVCTGVSVFGPSLLFLWLPLFCSFWSNLPPFLLRMPPLHLWVRKSMCILCLCDSDSGSWENALKHPLDISR